MTDRFARIVEAVRGLLASEALLDGEAVARGRRERLQRAPDQARQSASLARVGGDWALADASRAHAALAQERPRATLAAVPRMGSSRSIETSRDAARRDSAREEDCPLRPATTRGERQHRKQEPRIRPRRRCGRWRPRRSRARGCEPCRRSPRRRDGMGRGVPNPPFRSGRTRKAGAEQEARSATIRRSEPGGCGVERASGGRSETAHVNVKLVLAPREGGVDYEREPEIRRSSALAVQVEPRLPCVREIIGRCA